MSNIDHSTAVVLSGGGAYGAFEVGILKALTGGECAVTNYIPLNAGVFTGTSVGAFNAAVMVMLDHMEPAEAGLELERIWRQHVASGPGTCGNGVLRYRANPAMYLDPACVFGDP